MTELRRETPGIGEVQSSEAAGRSGPGLGVLPLGVLLLEGKGY